MNRPRKESACSPKEVYLVEKVEAKKDPCQIFATFDLNYAIEEANALNEGRTLDKPCAYRVSPCPYKEKE